ncbi:acetyl-CoA hydrolase/transferase C-terminal domain-containing protein [Actinomycetospora termitidis]|uniref:Acetyl-CoA hydrolase/transferase C-terminal domain-containing protein n=1 Tax=Actinomycetospora termitidis TaxID=3053470 RepID=A0ABT7MD23_9PSEU|nr:acetyl-CoA hydrolase/transferase C-terminal domain-containing protein [Actinomycetospora sp. Odt1-22]MDL5158569.1 acetyl-CoA hydrolase/transferase C-terminal domain-containing protein [Actinomycetospora sp. Odt1-22]
MPEIDSRALAALVRPGARIALADGTGTPQAAFAALGDVARERGGVRLVLGWMPAVPEGLDLAAFADARTVMPGWGLRAGVAGGLVRSVPARLSAVPALVAGPLRPDLLVVAAVPGPDGLSLGSEVSWVRAAVEAGVPIAAVVDDALPRAAAGPPLPEARTTVIGRVRRGPAVVPVAPEPSPEHRRIGELVAGLLPDDARVQWAPGQLGQAVVRAILERGRPVHADSGLLGDPVVDLDEAGLLASTPVATYLVGTPRLYDWADAQGRAGRPVVHGVEVTHDQARLAADPPLVAVNTAVEIDADGQVNVEGTASALVGGIGGHPDYAAAATRSGRGLSVVALASTHRGRPTMVERLSRPVTTASHDVDVVVTEHGTADLRGLDRDERRAALARLWV